MCPSVPGFLLLLTEGDILALDQTGRHLKEKVKEKEDMIPRKEGRMTICLLELTDRVTNDQIGNE